MTTLEQKQITLLLALDRACDQGLDEQALALEVIHLVAEAVQADLALLSLPDEVENGGSWQVQAIADHAQIIAHFSIENIKAMIERIVNTASKQPVYETVDLGPDAAPLFVRVELLQVNGDLLGVMVLARAGKGFLPPEKDLFAVAASRIDSGLRQAQTLRLARRESLALQTVLRIDRIRDTSQSMDEMLSRTLGEVCNAIPAEIAYVMLFDRQGNRLEMQAITDSHLLKLDKVLNKLYDIADQAVDSGNMVHWRGSEGLVRAVLSIPLLLGSRIIGVLGILNPVDRPAFSVWDGRLFSAIGSQLDTAIFERLETQRLRDAFGRNVGEKVMERLLQVTNRDLLKGDRMEVTALFSDIRGFTATTTQLDPEVMQEMTNIHLDAMTAVILENEGTLDKFLGDGIMAFFNAPERQTDHAVRSIQTALAMQVAHKKVMAAWEDMGLPPCPMGIGIALGEAIAGNFGSAKHSEFTVIGREVNLAARLCGIAEGGQILINSWLYEQVKSQVEVVELPPVSLKGFTGLVPVWQVIDMRSAAL